MSGTLEPTEIKLHTFRRYNINFTYWFRRNFSRAVLNQPLGVLWGGRFDRDAAGALILDSQVSQQQRQRKE
jgi:hypothetical protein